MSWRTCNVTEMPSKLGKGWTYIGSGVVEESEGDEEEVLDEVEAPAAATFAARLQIWSETSWVSVFR